MQITCAKCGKSYEFDASAIPEAGYDAQCTDCKTVFFVAKSAASAQPATVTLIDHEDSTPGEPEGMHAMAEGLGPVAGHPEGKSAEDDFDAMAQRRAKRLKTAGAAIGVALAVSAGLYFMAPTVFDKTIGPLIHVKAAIHPDAIAHYAKGVAAMWADTHAAYEEASGHFDAALKADALYPEALAMAGIALLLHGTDFQEQAQRTMDQGGKIVAEMRAIEELPPKQRARATERIEELRKTAQAKSEESAKLLEHGGKLATQGQNFVQQGIEKFPANPTTLLAVALLNSTDPDRLAKAEQYMTESIEHRTDVPKLNLEDPPDPWAPFIYGKVKQRSEPAEARKGFEAAFKKEPLFSRAHYLLASLFEEQKNFEGARRAAEDTVAKAPNHEKAKALLARTQTLMAQAVPPAAASGHAPAASEPKAKKRGGKKAKGRRGR